LATSTALGKLKLSLANLFQVFASLDEGLIFSEDALINVPAILGRFGDDTLLDLCADFLPLFAAVDALIQVTNAFFDITSEHILAINLVAASLVDLVADFG
jgi:hypothetical protein